MTTREAAALLNVGTSTIKRWSDEGRLQCIKTAGGHRRFYRSEVLALRGNSSAVETELSLARILDDLDGHATLGTLMQMRAHRGSWCGVAGEIGKLLEEIGDNWRAGKLSLVDEHVISERLMRGISAVCQSIPLSSVAPVCLFVMAVGDEHTLGLRLAELTAREMGWQALWVGSKTPLEFLPAALTNKLVRALAVSASRYSCDQADLVSQAGEFSRIARAAEIPLAFGGCAPWPEPLEYGSRVVDFVAFREFLQGR